MLRVALVAVIALGLAARLAVWEHVFTPSGTELVPADSHGYLTVVRAQLEAGRWVSRTIPDVAFPTGGPAYFPWLHLTLVTIAVKVAGLAHAETAAAWVGPALWLAWLGVALFWLRRRVPGPWLALVAAVWSWCLVHVEVSTLGTADHHVHEAFVAVAAALACGALLERPSTRSAVALGLVLGLSRLLVTSAFALPPLVALAAAWFSSRELTRALGLAAGTASATALAGALLVGAGLSSSYELFGAFQPLFAGACLLAACAVSAVRSGQRASAGAALLGAVVALVLLAPELARAVGHLGRHDAILGVIDEATPLLSDWRFGLALCGPLALLAPFAVWRLLVKPSAWRVTVAVMTAGWLVAALAQARFAAAFMGVLPLAVVATFEPPREGRPRAVTVGLAALCLVMLPGALSGTPWVTPSLASRVRPTLEWLRTGARHEAVVADPYLGLFTAWYARRPVVASTLAQMTEYATANDRARAVLDARDDGAVEAGLAALDAGLVIASPPFANGSVAPGSLAERLGRPVLSVPSLELLYESAESRRDDGRALLRVFRRVPGAAVEGLAEPGARITGRVAIEARPGELLEYRAEVMAGDGGTWVMRVPQPGRLELSDGTAVTVSPEAVEHGETLRTSP
ncbi:MAG: hypothetical protein JNK82_17705 [Myxococcaceae bacterium]|nr:hypothetical protein [Myxococcaceae bacterium]